MKFKYIYKEWKFYFLLSVILAIIISLSSRNLDKKIDIEDTDALEYQLEAVNLYHYHQFPVIGFIGNTDDYKLDTNARWNTGNAVRFSEIKRNGPISDMLKPPLYPLVLATLYKISGYQIWSIRCFNIFVLCFISVFQMYMGYRLFGLPGIFLGAISGYLYYSSVSAYIDRLYPNHLVQFLLFLVYLIATAPRTRNSAILGIIMGFLMGCMVLTNGNVLFVPLIYFTWRFYRYIFKSQSGNFALQFAGFLLPLLSWVIFANILFYNTSEERTLARRNIMRDTPLVISDINPFSDQAAGTGIDTLAWKYIMRRITAYSLTDGFILLSKQPYGDEILGVHNEYCADGNWHPEWRFLKNSYYTKHPSDDSRWVRIFDFYQHNPEYLIINTVGKFRQTAYSLSSTYYISIILLGLLTITTFGSYKLKWAISLTIITAYMLLPFDYGLLLAFIMFLTYNIGFFLLNWPERISWVMPCIVTNVTLITFISLGEPRYIQGIGPVITLGVFYLALNLLKQLKPVQNRL